jgi:hypothetical protein
VVGGGVGPGVCPDTAASLVGERAQQMKPEASLKPCARARARAALIAAGRMLRAAVVPIDMNSTNGGLYKWAVVA